MSNLSDGYALNAHIRSSDPIPSTAMHDALVSLAHDMHAAATGGPVMLAEWVTWARKSQLNANALIRVLFLVVAINEMSADDVTRLAQEFRATSRSPHRPPRPIRQPGPRKSQQLW